MPDREDLRIGEIVERVAETLDDFGPFEADPHLAVAVSGGADSLALMLLCDAWARSRGARLTVLTVDHGLVQQLVTEIIDSGILDRTPVNEFVDLFVA